MDGGGPGTGACSGGSGNQQDAVALYGFKAGLHLTGSAGGEGDVCTAAGAGAQQGGNHGPPRPVALVGGVGGGRGTAGCCGAGGVSGRLDTCRGVSAGGGAREAAFRPLAVRFPPCRRWSRGCTPAAPRCRKSTRSRATLQEVKPLEGHAAGSQPARGMQILGVAGRSGGDARIGTVRRTGGGSTMDRAWSPAAPLSISIQRERG